jgi:hypothetical protein
MQPGYKIHFLPYDFYLIFSPFNSGKIFALFKKKNMNTDTEKFPQQDAPEKNTDHAFVQVGKDGQAVMPKAANDETAPKENSSTEADETQQ